MSHSLLRIREMRRAADLTLDEVSRKSGVPLTTIADLERNERNPRIKTLKGLAAAFGVTVDDLLVV